MGDKLECPAFSPAIYPPGVARGSCGVEALSLWVGDLDGVSQDALQRCKNALTARGWAAAAYTTWSNAKKPHSLRLVVPLSREVSPTEWADVWHAINDALGRCCDDKCTDLARIYFAPAHPRGEEDEARFEEWPGAPIDVDRLLGERVPGTLPPESLGNATTSGEPVVAKELKEFAGRLRRRNYAVAKEAGAQLLQVCAGDSFAKEGGRDDTLFKLAHRIVEEFPERDASSIAEHFRLSLQVMAKEAPGCPTVEDALEKVERAQKKHRQEKRTQFARGDETEVSDRLVQDLRRRGGGHAVYANGDFRYFQQASGLWEIVEQPELSRIVQGYAGKPVAAADGKTRPLRVNEKTVKGAAMLASHTLNDRTFFDEAPAGLVFNGTFVRVDAEGIHKEAAQPDHRARWGYDFELDLNTTPDRFLDFLEETHGESPDSWNVISLLCEYFGIALLGIAPRYARALVLYGAGDDGKSVTIEVGCGLFPPSDVASVAPSDFGKDQYRNMLVNKRLNCVTDLPINKLPDSGEFKKIINGEPTTAKQLYKDPRHFRPNAAHVFSTNQLPATRDFSHGFYKRLIILPHERQVPLERQQPNLAAEILAAERPAIIGVALQAAQEMLASGRSYKVPAICESAKREYMRESNPVAAWVDEACSETGVARQGSTLEKLYPSYRAAADTTGNRALSKSKFDTRLRQLNGGRLWDGNNKRFRLVVTGQEAGSCLSNDTTAVLQFLVAYLLKPGIGDNDARGSGKLCVREGKLCVNIQAVVDCWKHYVPNTWCPDTAALTQIMKSLSEQNLVRLNTSAGRPRFYAVNTEKLIAWGEESGFATREAIEKSLQRNPSDRIRIGA